MIHLLLVDYSRLWQFRQVVSRLLVELVRLVHDVGLVDLLRPVPRLDLLHRDRDGLLPVAQHVHHVLGDRLGETGLLPLGFTRPELHDDMRHDLLLRLFHWISGGPGFRHCTVWPPSMTMACPMTKAAASEHSQTTAAAISSGLPIRPTRASPLPLTRP